MDGRAWERGPSAANRLFHGDNSCAPIGVFVTRALPSGPMEREAAAVGRFHAEATGRSYPRLQILTLAELFQGKRPDIPFVDPTAAFRRVGRETTEEEGALL